MRPPVLLRPSGGIADSSHTSPFIIQVVFDRIFFRVSVSSPRLRAHISSENMPETRFLYTRFDAHGPHQTDALAHSKDSPSHFDETPSTNSSNISAPATSGVSAALRRVHTKSRRGCLSCKARRIKVSNRHLLTPFVSGKEIS